MSEVKTIVEPAFVLMMYEVEKHIKEGWSLSQTKEPIYIAGLYDVEMVKGEEKVAVAAEAQKEDEPDEEKQPARRGPKPKASK